MRKTLMSVFHEDKKQHPSVVAMRKEYDEENAKPANQRKPRRERLHLGKHIVWGEPLPLCSGENEWVSLFYPELQDAVYNDQTRRLIYDFIESQTFYMLGQAAPTTAELKRQMKVDSLSRWVRRIHENVNDGKLNWDTPIGLPDDYTSVCELLENGLP